MDQQVNSLLPKIPGLSPSYLEIKDKYPIGADLKLVDDVRFIKSIEKQTPMLKCDPDVAMVMLAKGQDVINKPNWLVFDQEVLTFDASCQTTTDRSSFIESNLRQLKIIYFLRDETIQVNEPSKNNSGTVQGCLIKRQKIPLPGCDRNTGPYYKIADLNVNKTVFFYEKEIKIMGVDAYTRDFLLKMGLNVPKNKPVPVDPYYDYRKNNNLDIPDRCTSNMPNRNKKFCDEIVLRFRGYWDDRLAGNGELHFYDVQYYLVDDTMQIIEDLVDESKTSGITHKLCVKRQKLPKEKPWCRYPGFSDKHEIMKVITTTSNKDYYKMDKMVLGDGREPFYRYSDLYIGNIINVYDRLIVLVKCDERTKDFYRHIFGIQKFCPITAPKTLREIELDMRNEKKVEVVHQNQDEVARKRLIKFGGTGVVFGFVIKMVTENEINQQRNFMLKYYLDDNEVAIYEYRETNSGMRGGMFRSKRGFSEHQDKSKVLVFNALYVGAHIFIDEFEFVISEVDDKTLHYMVENYDEFAHSNVETALAKVRQAIDGRFASLDEFSEKCFQGRELVERNEFREIVSFGGEALDPHSGAVLAHVFKRPDPFEPYTDHDFRSVLQDTLRRDNFIHFEGLRNNFRSRKAFRDQEELTTRKQSEKAMKSNNVPFSNELTDIILDRFTNKEDGLVNYGMMTDFLDYITEPTDLPFGMIRDILFAKPKKVLVRVNEFVDALRQNE